MHEEILDDLQRRTNFDYDKMSYEDKLEMSIICKDILKMLDDYYISQYQIIKSWANIDLNKAKIQEKQCDFKRIRTMQKRIRKLQNNK